jgi:type IV secretion system protein VirD4
VSTLRELHHLLAASGGRLYVGSSRGGLVLAPPEQSLLVLGPPRSGKTTALAVPNVLAAPGAAICTSTKLDVMAATLAGRSQTGRSWLLDPSGSVSAPPGVERIRWSPAAAARTWEDALLLARAMSAAARPQGRVGESAHWTERAEALLAPLLHAASLRGSGMDRVLRWVLRHDLDEPADILAVEGVGLAADVLAGIGATDPRESSGIWSTAAGILAAYRSERVLDLADPPNFDPATLASSADTVYVCSPSRHQELVAPIIVAFLDQARAGAYVRADGGPPLTLILDEMANIAPIPNLPSLLSEGGCGVLTLGCLQDLSQARTRWGPAAEGFLSLFGAKVVLPGIGDLATLELVSRLAGDAEVAVRGVSRGPWWSGGRGAPTVSWNGRRQPRLPVDAVSHQPPGTAILLSGASPPVTVRLPPWWAIPPFQPARGREPADRSIGR